ncbi:hypothetical protein C0992_006555 [Termitomyces sp. T32_za158]|nr:hypothetical protein C0992_006555 [Termitomyces sp. T32_za158]
MSPYTVNVSGLSPTTTDAQLNDFFTFCGKISKVEKEKDRAVIHFEMPNSAKTALMLNGGTLDGSVLSITSENTYQDEESKSKDEGLEQHEKPRAGIAAEYLAHGYVLSHKALERAIEIDNEQGISKRFLEYFHHVDKSLGSRALGPDQTISSKVQSTVDAATQKAKTVDEQKGYSKTAYDFYAKAIASPLGQKVRSFYTSTSKRVQDIHEEARRIADQHKAPSGAADSGEKVEAGSESVQTK